jgi:hypothetical protein
MKKTLLLCFIHGFKVSQLTHTQVAIPASFFAQTKFHGN